MIKNFKHKGLRQFFEKGSTVGIDAKQSGKIRLRLAVIDAAEEINDIDRPGYNLHPLTGGPQGSMGNYCYRKLASYI